MNAVESRFVMAGGIRTHYLSAGSGPVLVLLHSGEFGACAELTWEHNILALAEHFTVIAPDWLGFGKTEKLFSFEGMRSKRIDHMAQFLDALGIKEADFMGNSMGGTLLIEEASEAQPAWPMRRIVVVSGGGDVPNNAARQILNGYDGTREAMKEVLEALIVNERIRKDDAYIDRRHRLSLEPGAWEATAAVRFKAPFRTPSQPKPPADYSNIKQPLLLIAGEQDSLRAPEYAYEVVKNIRNAKLHIIKNAGHCPQIDAPDEFNSVALDFLLQK